MRFFRKTTEQSEAPCPRCCIAVATDAHECPYCGLDLDNPEAPQDGWTPPVRHEDEPAAAPH